MILPDTDLKQLVNDGFLPRDGHIGPSSIDLRLSNEFCFLHPKKEVVSLDEPSLYNLMKKDVLILPVGGFVLASTEEHITIPYNMAGFVAGRSSVGRMGLQVQNAGFIDAGFSGKITLELSNQSGYPLEIKAGMRICQIVYLRMTKESESPYSGKYQLQDSVTPSKLYLDK